jgi:hypothetical protein
MLRMIPPGFAPFSPFISKSSVVSVQKVEIKVSCLNDSAENKSCVPSPKPKGRDKIGAPPLCCAK